MLSRTWLLIILSVVLTGMMIFGKLILLLFGASKDTITYAVDFYLTSFYARCSNGGIFGGTNCRYYRSVYYGTYVLCLLSEIEMNTAVENI